jgi:hypothetical protein
VVQKSVRRGERGENQCRCKREQHPQRPIHLGWGRSACP